MTARTLFLTVGGAGLSPKAPGTVGSLVALPLGLAILQYVGTGTLLLASLLISVIAVKQITPYLDGHADKDPQEIVIDELAGMWIALALTAHLPLAIQAVGAFAAFRLFDITKPSIIGRIDREVEGGWGIMGDDLLAGLFGGLLVDALWYGYTLFV